MPQHDLTERLLRLRSVPVFQGMSAGELAPLAATMRSARFERGDVILREDEPPRAFHMILHGAVTMRRRGRKLRTITAPGGVGFLSLLARTSGGTAAVAEAYTETFELGVDALDELFEDQFPVVLGTLRWITERLIQENLTQPPPKYQPEEDGFANLIGDRELGIVERIFLLRRTRAFKNANVNSIARLARQMKETRVPAGTVVWHAGDPAWGSAFIVKGRMESRWKDGTVRQQLGPGYIVGGMESLAQQARWNDLVAIEPAVYLEGSKDALIDMFEDDLEVALKFMSMMATALLAQWDRKAEEEARAAEGAPPSSEIPSSGDRSSLVPSSNDPVSEQPSSEVPAGAAP